MTPCDRPQIGFWIPKGAAFIAALFLFVGHALAQSDVTIRATNGLEMTGQVLGYDGRYLRIRTEQGDLTLDYDIVECLGANCPDPDNWLERIRFSGTPRLGEVILPALIEGYGRSQGLSLERIDIGQNAFMYKLSRPGERQVAEVQFRLSDTARGLSDLLASEADMLMAARQLTAAELADARDAGLGDLAAADRLRVVAYDAVVPIVSPASSIAELRYLDLARLFSGDVRNWSGVGGTDRPVALHMGPLDVGLSAHFVATMLDPARRTLSGDVVVHHSDAAIVDAVLADPGAIGLVSFEAPGIALPLPLVGRCGLRAVANLDTVRTGDYPLSLPLFLYLPERRAGPFGHAFIAWVGGPDAQRILRRIGVPGQMAGRLVTAEQGDRWLAAISAADDELGLRAVQTFAASIRGHDRLTPTFRFQPGSATLTPASQAQLRVLARSLLDRRFQGQDLKLIGFSDGRGQPAANAVLSERRAETVRTALEAMLGGALPQGQRLQVLGMGDVSPIGCDDTPWGREINRRVELWAPSLAP